MSRAEDLLASYAAAFEAGRAPDAHELLEAAGPERPQLEAALERYLRDAPRRAWDGAAFAGSRAAGVADGLDKALGSGGGLWPSLLPRLRARAELRRADLVGRLAASLGAQSQGAKVGAYYHQMEHGLLPAEGVSDRVLGALGSIVGESARTLREAGSSTFGEASGPLTAPAAAFARTAAPDASYSDPAADAAIDASREPGEQSWDEVDRLFRGGPE